MSASQLSSILKDMPGATPTTIFSGFLGSGKTTIILHLVEELQAHGEQVVYIKNEIGNTDIDGQLMRSKNIKTRELLNGCICCTLVGPFTAALTEVVELYHPGRIFIEASGAADPSALALMVSSHPLLRRDGVIGIVDVLNFTGYADLTETTKNQTKFIDLLIFNKVELATLEEKRRVVGYVRELNSHSPIIEAPGGKVPASAVLGLDSRELTSLLDSQPTSDHEHVENDQFGSFSVVTEGATTQEQLLQLLENLPAQLFRAKGVVQLQAGDWVLCNMVGGRADVQPLGAQTLPDKNILVFIGVQTSAFETEVRQKVAEIFV